MGLTRVNNQALPTLDSDKLPSGTVLQVKSTTKTDTWTFSGTSTEWSGDVTGLTVSITPKSTNSKILVMVDSTVSTNNNSYPSLFQCRLLRGGTQIVGAFGSVSSVGSSSNNVSGSGVLAGSYLDSPSTTSAITYSIQLRQRITSSADVTVRVNESQGGDDRGSAHITVMEIAG